MYKIQVLEKGNLVEDRPWAKNMILDQGMDYALSGSYNSVGGLMRYHCVGTGTNPVLASNTGLQAEVKRTGTLLTGAGNVGRTYSSGIVTFRFTFDHTVEGAGGANYTEHGVSPSATAGKNLFARSLISGGTVSVAEGQQLRVIYDVSVALTPYTQTAATVGGTGWPVSPATNCDGIVTLWKLNSIAGELSTTGALSSNSLICMSALGLPSLDACSSVTLPTGIDGSGGKTAISGSRIAYSRSSYTPGSFTRSFTPNAYATASSFSSTSIIGWAITSDYSEDAIIFKYNQAQTKASTHRLRYPSITVTWARA